MSSEKKRKRESTSTSDGQVKQQPHKEVKMKIAVDTGFTPIIATTPGIQLPPHTAFEAYIKPRPGPSKKRKEGSSSIEGEEFLVHASTERVDYEGRELAEDAEVERYYIGIYDPRTGEVQVHLAPRVHVRREIKTQREKDLELAQRASIEQNFRASRAILGVEFGTKKSKKAIERRDLNQVDVATLDKDVTTSLVQQIGENTESMPTRAELDKTHEEARLIPPVKENVTTPAEVYDINDIVPVDEFEAIWISEWLKKGKEGTLVVPGQSHVSNRIALLGLLQDPNTKNKRKLKILRYIAYLKDLYSFLSDKRESERLLLAGKDHEISKRLGIPMELLEPMLKRYTGLVSTMGGQSMRPKRIASPAHMAKLLNYMVILCLMVEDNFQVDVYYLKDDLGIQTKDLLSAFSNVGCKRKDISAIAAEAYGISKAEMKLHKVAFLTAKPEFPRAPVRRGGEKRK